MLLTNIRSFTDMEVVLLFSKPHDYNPSVPRYLVNKYPGVRAFVYEDNRADKSYIPSIRPYLWWQYLKNHPERENETYFYIDSDIIFREFPDLASLNVSTKHWVGSDCNNYINYDYLKQVEKGPQIISRMAQYCGIDWKQMVGVPGLGAHIVLANPTAEMWRKSYNRSNILWHYFDGVQSNIQKWTAEMWAQLWTMVEHGIITETPKELDFCFSTDPLSRWDETKILHNSGVMEPNLGMFYKGKYQDQTPFGENFDWVDKSKCSRKYVDALEKVKVS